MMNILGIIAFQGHTSSAVLIKEGKVMAAVAEERFTRIKNDNSFPKNSIDYVLREGKIGMAEVDEIAFAWNPFLNLRHQLKFFVLNFPHSLTYVFKKRKLNGQISRLKKFLLMCKLKSTVKKYYQRDIPVKYVSHHLSHSVSSYVQAGYDEAVSIVADGMGEFIATSIYKISNNKHTLIYKEYFPHSLGILYSAITQFLNFCPDSDEYKVMGLCAYGKNTFLDKLKKLVRVKDGSYKLNLEYFKLHRSSDNFYSDKLARYLNQAGLTKSDRADIACSLQTLLEDIVIYLLKSARPLIGDQIDKLCTSGGVFLNCLLNQKLRESRLFGEYYFSPVAGDIGSSIGAAQYRYYIKTGLKAERFYSLYLGPGYSSEYIVSLLKERGLNFTKELSLEKKVAHLLADGKIVCWFQGRMEFGPRSLGQRNILADPRKAEMKDIINEKVKRREKFRPFAPSILEEFVQEYFYLPEGRKDFSYMIETLNIKEDKKNMIPAVVHVDGTSRVQTVNEKQNLKYYVLIKEFYKLTKVPLILNTSFNTDGEPIVNSPQDALSCFLNTAIDYLAIGDYLVLKN